MRTMTSHTPRLAATTVLLRNAIPCAPAIFQYSAGTRPLAARAGRSLLAAGGSPTLREAGFWVSRLAWFVRVRRHGKASSCDRSGQKVRRGPGVEALCSTRCRGFVIIGDSDRRTSSLRAEVAELADAQASGACGRKVVEVQILSSAPNSNVSL